MNKTLLPSLLGLVLFAFSYLPAQNTCFQSWRYVYNIPIFNPNGTPQTDFQVRLNINTQALVQAGKMNADGSDIRFADGERFIVSARDFRTMTGLDEGLAIRTTVVITIVVAVLTLMRWHRLLDQKSGDLDARAFFVLSQPI